MTDKKEYLEFSVKAEDIDDKGVFKGYASTFGKVGDRNCILDKGCFDETLKKIKKVVMLWQHDWYCPIGSVYLEPVDDKGLPVIGQINLDTDKGKYAYSLIKNGDIDSMSIGFYATKVEWDEKTDMRTIKEMDLFEISVVTFPANENAKIKTVNSVEVSDKVPIEAFRRSVREAVEESLSLIK